MCVIVAVLGSGAPKKADLTRGCINNPDGFGWGIVTCYDNAWDTIWGKTMSGEEAINDYLSALEEHGDHVQASAFHARIATHGNVEQKNCHPFPINGDPSNLLFHNGILPIESKDGRSDTAIFAEDIMPRFGAPSSLEEDVVLDMVSEWATGSKFVILSSDPEVMWPLTIVNEDCGFWEEDIWFSNTSCQEKRYSYPKFTASTKSTKVFTDNGSIYIPTPKKGTITNTICDNCKAVIPILAEICDMCWSCVECSGTVGTSCLCYDPETIKSTSDASSAWDLEMF